MDSKDITKGIIKAVLWLAGGLLLLFFLYKIRAVLIYIAISVVVSLIARPFIRFLRNKLKFGNTLAAVTAMLVIVLLVGGLFSMLIPLIIKQGENLSLLNSDTFRQNAEQLYTEVRTYLESRNINLTDKLSHFDLSAFLQNIPDMLNGFISLLGSFTVGLFSVLFISFFLMKDNDIVNKSLYTVSPKGKEQKIIHSFEKIKDLLSRYFIGLVVQISILFTIYTVILLVAGVENAVVIAFIVALLNLIPYVGPAIGLFLIAFLTMTDNLQNDFQTDILPTTLWVMAGYLAAQMLDAFVNQPLIFSKSVRSHPLEIFLVIIVGGLLFGVFGMMLAVPSYTAIKVILKEFLSDNKIVKSLTKNY
jgi:predicted PurR-regulated permease PerM